MNFELLHPADQLVEMMNRIYRYGMTTTSGGNLSIRDENGDIWITPSGVDKGSLTRDDIMQVKPDGTYIGKHKPSVEFPFHRDIYRSRPDISGVVHAHPPVLVGYSLLRRAPETRLLPEVWNTCGPVAQVPYNAPGTKELGEDVSARFAEGYNTVLMANHGIACGSKNLHEAFVAFETITLSAQMELDAMLLGTPRTLGEAQLAAAKEENRFEAAKMALLPGEQEAREKMCALARRCYDRKIFSAARGVVSMRICDDSMLILPAGKDRLNLKPEDIVRVQDGKAEAGKIPAEMAKLHQKIYAAHPDVNAIIISQAPSIMAFAVTGEEFEARMISEGYIILGDVQRKTCETGALDADAVADMIQSRKPVVVVDNRCAIATGASLINAFDRMEVLECSAAAVIAARRIGQPVSLTEEEIEGTRKALNLA